MDKSKILAIKFNSKNYFAWGFQFQLYVEGKDIWGHNDGSTKKTTDKMETWDNQEAQIMSWIMSSIEPHIALNLHPYKTVVDMWSYL